MVADKDAHTGDSTPKCVACSQPCVLEQTRWVCKCYTGLPDMQRSFEALRLDGTSTAHDTRESKDSSAVDYFPRTITHQDGTPCDSRAICSNGISQPGSNHHDDDSMTSPSRVGAKQDTHERQGSSASPYVDDSAHEYVPFGTHNTGGDQGQSDEDMDLEDVDNIDENNSNERAHIESIHSWLQETTSTDTVERRADLENRLREFDNIMTPRTVSNMAQYGDAGELDDMEMDE